VADRIGMWRGVGKYSCAACPACPVGPADRTGVAPEDGTGVRYDKIEVMHALHQRPPLFEDGIKIK